MDVDQHSGTVSCLTDSGEVYEGCDIPKDELGKPDEVGQQLINKFEAGDEFKIVVLSIMGKEMILEIA